MYQVRRILVGDVPRVVELSKQIFYLSRHKYLTFDADKLSSLLSICATAEDMICFVCVDESNRIIGAINGVAIAPCNARETIAYQQHFILDPSERGFIQAKLLLRSFEDWARSRGAIMLSLFIDYGPDDDRVANLCKRAGFMQQGISLTKEL